MKKIHNLFLVALLAACSTVSVRAMEESVEWPQREEAKAALAAFDYQKCENLYRSALKDKRFKGQALADLKQSVEERLDPFGAFHFVRGVLYKNQSSTNKEDADLALKYLIVSYFRTMLDIKVCELVYFKKTSYATKLNLLARRYLELFQDEKVKSLAQYRTYSKALADAKELLRDLNVHDYAPSFWATSVNSSWRNTFYFYNPTGSLAREIKSHKSDSDLQVKDSKKRCSVGTLLLKVFSGIENWDAFFKLSTEELPVVQDPDFNPREIESFGLAAKGIVVHGESEEGDADDYESDSSSSEEDIEIEYEEPFQEEDTIEVAVPTPSQEDTTPDVVETASPAQGTKAVGALGDESTVQEYDQGIQNTLGDSKAADMTGDQAPANPPVQSQQPVEEGEMPALEDAEESPALSSNTPANAQGSVQTAVTQVQQAPVPSDAQPEQNQAVPMDVEEQGTPVVKVDEESATSGDPRLLIEAVVENTTDAQADNVEVLTAELAQLGVQDGPQDMAVAVAKPKIKPPVPARPGQQGGTILGAPGKPVIRKKARKVGGRRTPDSGRKKKKTKTT